MAIGRLFYEIGGDKSRLDETLRQALHAAKEAGVEVTRAGQAFISRFDEALNPTKKLTEQIRLLEAAGKSQADIQRVMGDKFLETAKQARALGQEIDESLIKKYVSLEARLKSTGESMMRTGRTMSMYVTAPIVAVGAAAFKAADDYDKAMNAIRIGTGATGTALTGLGEDMKAVWGTVPASAEQIGRAIADLNTRLGIAGQPLQEMATQMLNVARITRTDLTMTIAGATRLFGDWSVATGRQSETLDYLFRVSQQTGISFQKLLETTVQYGAPMRALGFDLEQAAAAMGKWEKEGVNMETVLSGLRFALGEMAKAGADPVQALEQIQTAIRNAKSESEATAIAFQAFGKRAAVDLGRAIMEGRFNIVELVKTLKESGETINAAANDAKSFSDRMIELKERIEKALLPVGVQLLEAFESLQPTIIAGVEAIARLTRSFADMDPGMQKFLTASAALTVALGPLAFGIGGLVSGFGAMIGILGGTGEAIALLTNLGIAAAGAAAAFAGFKLAEWFDEAIRGAETFRAKLTDLGLEHFFQNVGSAARQSEDDILRQARALAEQARQMGVIDERLEIHKDIIASGELQLPDIFQRGYDESAKAYLERMQQLIDAFKQAHPEAAATVEDLGNIAGAAAGAGAGVGMLDEKMKSLRETTEKAMRPMQDLALTIQKQMSLGFSQADLVALYRDQILKAAEAQARLGQPISETAQRLVAMATEMKKSTDAARALADALKEDDEALKKASLAVKEMVETRLAELNKSMGEFSTKARGMPEDLRPLQDIPTLLKPTSGKLLDIAMGADKANEAGRSLASTWMTEVSTAFTDFSRQAADAIIKAEGLVADFGRALLRSFIQDAIMPLQGIISNFIGQVAKWLGGGGFSWGSILQGAGGGGSVLDVAKGIGLRVGGGIGGTMATSWALGGGLPSLATVTASTSALAAGGMMAGGGVAGIPTGLATAGAGGGGFMGSMGAFFTNPWTIGIGAALGAGYLAYKAWTQDAYEAGAKEVLRDLNLQISQGNWKAFTQGLGLSEKQLYPIRLDIEMSPKFLTEVAWPLAVQQGKIDEFLASLRDVNTVMGKIDLATPFEEFLRTGDVDALNKAYIELFQHSQALVSIMPDFAERLAAVADPARQMAYALSLTAESFTALKAAILQLVPATKDIYQRFLETGEITDELAAKIEEFGGDVQKFRDLAALNEINSQFAALVEHFRQTGRILPELGDIITRFGGDVGAIQGAASQLQILQASLSGITDLAQGLKRILPELSPIQQILSGEWGSETWGNLAAMGFDPAKLTRITDLIRFETGWESAIAQFQKTGKLAKGGILEQALWQFGGTAGTTALERYGQGFNTITPALLDVTKASMDAAYRAERQSVLDYLQSMARSTTSAITEAEKIINEQLELVGDNIAGAIQDAAMDVIAAIDKILAAIQARITTPSGVAVPVPVPTPERPEHIYDDALESYAVGGYVEKTGAAVVHEGETIVPAGQGNMTINVFVAGPVVAENVDQLISESIRRGLRRGDYSYLMARA